MKVSWAALALLVLAGRAPAAQLITDLEYGRAAGVSLKLDVSVPAGPGPFPVALVVHGGGWTRGDKAADIQPLLATLTGARFLWFSINYRLAPQYRFPACIEDVETALRWVKAHAADYKGDPSRLALVGESAGGQLVSLAAVRAAKDTRPTAVVAFYAPNDLESDTVRRRGLSPSMQALLGLTTFDAAARQQLQAASPVSYLHRDLPPFLLIHGTADESVSYQQSISFQARLRELDVPCDLITVRGGPHGLAKWEALDTSYKAGLVAWLHAALRPEPTGPEQVAITRLPNRLRVELGGKLFTQYFFRGADRPYCYPLLTPDGTSLSRDFPMSSTPGEDHDHPWHRSLWFAHSVINGVDFWNEGTGDAGKSPTAKGKIVQSEILETRDGDVGLIRTRDRWLAPDGRLVCTDERTLRFAAAPHGRLIDFEVTLQAPADRPLLIGDNKDGTMALRLAQWMTLPHKYEGRALPGVGHIVTSTGVQDAAAWGKRADWCDYFAPHNGQIYGIAIFDHPQNLRHPTWWMARDYGLFGANPFGQHDYENLPDQPHAGDYTIPAGGHLTLRYRFFLHEGNPAAAEVTQRYAEYAAPPSP